MIDRPSTSRGGFTESNNLVCRAHSRHRAGNGHSSLSLMTMALAVAMVACEAATPKPGDPGPKGDPGEQGPPGTSGTPDNDLPMATKALPMVYLALGGTGPMKNTEKAPTDLSKHFEDKEKAALTYTFESSDTDVATAALMTGSTSKMVVKAGKKAGPATITVKVHDGINTDPGVGTFDVMVVSNNAKPEIQELTGPVDTANTDLAKLGAKLYVSRGVSVVTVNSPIYAGVAAGVQDDVTFSADIGMLGSGDDVVSVSVVKGSKPNDWDISLTPLTGGHQNVRLTIKDKFGVAADVGAADGEIGWVFEVYVNTPPKLVVPLDDSILASIAGDEVPIMITKHFDTGEATPTDGPVDLTSGATPPADLSGPAARTETGETVCSWSTSGGEGDDVEAGSFNVPKTTVGTYELTVACRDPEGIIASDTTMVTVRP